MNSTLRNEYLIGKNAQEALRQSHVFVFGCGGVGSFAIEALVRAGIGSVTVIDFDRVDETNLNRQLIATTQTLGQLKIDVMRDRALAIHPDLNYTGIAEFFDETSTLDLSQADYVIDAIDSVNSKLELMRRCQSQGIPLVMALGTARKLDASQVILTTLFKTSGDPLAKKVRIAARKAGLNDVSVVLSTEEPLDASWDDKNQKIVNGSMIFVPATAGLRCAQKVIQDIIQAQSVL